MADLDAGHVGGGGEEVVHEETPSPLNPIGVKGAGEAGAIPVGPLFAQAVEDALRSGDRVGDKGDTTQSEQVVGVGGGSAKRVILSVHILIPCPTGDIGRLDILLGKGRKDLSAVLGGVVDGLDQQ